MANSNKPAIRQKTGGVCVQTAFSNSTAASSVADNNTWANTGISCSITPLYKNSEIKLTLHGGLAAGIVSAEIFLRIDRSGVTLTVNDSSGTPVNAWSNVLGNSAQVGGLHLYADSSHNTTSSITYTIYAYSPTASANSVYVNREATDSNASSSGRYATSLMLEEWVYV